MNKLALLHFSWEYKDQLLPTFLYNSTHRIHFSSESDFVVIM